MAVVVQSHRGVRRWSSVLALLALLAVIAARPASARGVGVVVSQGQSAIPSTGYREDAFLAACYIDDCELKHVPTRDPNGVSANDGVPSDRTVDISASGRWVSFTTSGDNLVAGDTNQTRDVYMFDTCEEAPPGCKQEHRRVSLAADGAELIGGVYNHVMSGNGEYVVFAHNGFGDINIVPGGNPPRPQLYIARTGFEER